MNRVFVAFVWLAIVYSLFCFVIAIVHGNRPLMALSGATAVMWILIRLSFEVEE